MPPQHTRCSQQHVLEWTLPQHVTVSVKLGRTHNIYKRNAPTIHTLSTHNIYPQYIQLYILWVYIVGILYVLWIYIVGDNVVAPTTCTDLYILWTTRIYCGQQNGKLHPQYIRLHPQYICVHPQHIPTIHTAVCIVGIHCGCIHMYCG